MLLQILSALVSDSGGFKPQAFCSAGFASPSAPPAGDGDEAPALFPRGTAVAAVLELVCSRWAVCTSCWVGGSVDGDAGCFSGRLMGWQNPQGFVLGEWQKSQLTATAMLCGDEWGVAL